MVEEYTFRSLGMLLKEGTLEILDVSKDGKPKGFNDFRKRKRTALRPGGFFSPNTISIRLKELVRLGLLMKVIKPTSKGRDVVGYQITPLGKKVHDLAIDFDSKLAEYIKNN